MVVVGRVGGKQVARNEKSQSNISAIPACDPMVRVFLTSRIPNSHKPTGLATHHLPPPRPKNNNNKNIPNRRFSYPPKIISISFIPNLPSSSMIKPTNPLNRVLQNPPMSLGPHLPLPNPERRLPPNTPHHRLGPRRGGTTSGRQSRRHCLRDFL